MKHLRQFWRWLTKPFRRKRPDPGAIGRTAFVMQLAREWPEFRPPGRTAEEYGKAFVMAPLAFYRALEEREAA